MSGGGGTGDWSAQGATGIAVGGGAPGRLPCERLEFDARLRSVDPAQLEEVDVGEVLAVALYEATRPVVGVFRLTSSSDGPLGVLSERLSELVPCLSLLDFEADVLSITGGDVRVHVRPAAGA